LERGENVVKGRKRKKTEENLGRSFQRYASGLKDISKKGKENRKKGRKTGKGGATIRLVLLGRDSEKRATFQLPGGET